MKSTLIGWIGLPLKAGDGIEVTPLETRPIWKCNILLYRVHYKGSLKKVPPPVDPVMPTAPTLHARLSNISTFILCSFCSTWSIDICPDLLYHFAIYATHAFSDTIHFCNSCKYGVWWQNLHHNATQLWSNNYSLEIGARVVWFLNNALFHNYKQGNIIFHDISPFLNDSCNGPAIKYALVL